MDMLSSRSYLEMSQEQEAKISLNSSEINRRPSGPQASGIDQPTNENSDPSVKRGRPRAEAKDASAIEIRRAQRTYRLKKETTIQNLRSRVHLLEQTIEKVANLLDGAYCDSVVHLNEDPTLQPSVDYLARTRELILAEF
ncbi:hypothetical protein PDIG_30810 [Penicillium digitatum PHI26]|uniref:BZIP domain-containing protein n=2 Tax=Penicillium digitatum TaxID=36651 RepID=K9G0A2_PEND2|nr:hypothetical protein PDIP_65190 [Penicillium digitatum Pd1]EKV09437.1 hypothetical protein PDIP_65190 [Penicillium digitatum Pd1]EKV14804.1 hypothetical protein PDIG_30810 [Penicillium digitatum PHI26]